MKVFIFLVMIVLLADKSEGGWWSRTSKSVDIGVTYASEGASVTGTITIKWRKRRATEKHGKYEVVLQVYPCELVAYDLNQDGAIERDEIKGIFEDSTASSLFFNEADGDDDGSISKEEFAAFSKKISGCEK